jgi:SPP1 gp7 family putative phage head morphogenesis protein
MPRKIPLIPPPLGIERDYQKKLRSLSFRVKDIINKNIVQSLPIIMSSVELVRPDHSDGIGDDVRDLFKATRLQIDREIPEYEIDQIAQGTAEEINGWNKKQVHRMLKAGLGIDIFINEIWLRQEMENFVNANVSLIKSNNETFLKQVETTVFEGMRKGTRHEQIAKQILGFGKDELGNVSKFRKAKNRANLIARDQANKFNGKLNELRQTSIGVKKYTWRTVGDARVRDSHEARDGNIYTWAKGSEIGTHPGEEIQCRCWAEPVLSDLI